jgi:ribosomal protein S27AE
MNIFTFVSNVCATNEVSVNSSGVQRLVGTLRVAGFADEIKPAESLLAQQLIEGRLHKISNGQFRQAAAVSTSKVEPINSKAHFEEIDSFRSKNVCPRCKSNMERVKLANYEESAYCPRCKVALWMDSE